MMQLGPIAFANPWLLLALAALPAIWLVIRAIPPRARRFRFPPVRLLRQLISTDPPPQRTPPWLIFLRLLLATILILAFSQPIWRPAVGSGTAGSVLIVIDDGWIAAQNWRQRADLIRNLLEQARRENRQVQLMRTTPRPAISGRDPEIELGTLESPEEALRRLPTLRPKAWIPDHELVLAALADQSNPEIAAIHWLSNGQRYPGTDELEAILGELGPLKLYTDPSVHTPIALRPVQFDGVSFIMEAVRPMRDFPQSVSFQALAGDGRILQAVEAVIEAGSQTVTADLDLPARLRSEIARFVVGDVESAGATILIDPSNRIPAVGVVGTDSAESAQPLRSELYYIRRALEPHAQINTGQLGDLVNSSISALFLADSANLLPDQTAILQRWIQDDGGLLVRFAGSRMAEAEQDDLVPVRLRSGERVFGGSLSWEDPKSLAPFPEASPFFGLAIPGDIEVRRQILAVPSVDLSNKTWARLADGTPIVTAEQRGNGWVILFHTTANTDWSNLVLTGLFEAMIDRLLQLARNDLSAVTANSDGPLPPVRVMDGFGQVHSAEPDLPALPAQDFGDIRAGPEHPPGFYGSDQAPVALNIVSEKGPVGPYFAFRERLKSAGQSYDQIAVQDLEMAPALLLAALILAMVDLFASLALRGFIPVRWLAASSLLILIALQPEPVTAQERLQDDLVLEATRGTRLAYILTGDPLIDQMTENGMRGLERIVQIRTAIELDRAMGLQPSSGTMKLFPLVYWPVPLDAKALDSTELANLNDYLQSGGIVVFDTGVTDSLERSRGLANPQARDALERLLGPLALPPVVPVDDNHVLSKSFYLLNQFPGRITGRPVWVEKKSVGDPVYVSSVIMGSHDWVSAWAIDENRMRFTVPRLVGGPRQRELAFRFGINVVMYALTGTYKDDQLHLPAVLQRLGE